MKGVPLLLLISTVFIIGVVGYLSLDVERDLDLKNTESSRLEDVVLPESNTATSTIVAEVQVNTGTSSLNILSPEELRIRQLELKKTRWLSRNIVMDEPCDFNEIEFFADSLLDKTEWKNIVAQYPNRSYTRFEESPLYISVASRWLHGCFVRVSLKTNGLSQSEFSEYAKYTKTHGILTLLNNNETYDGGAVEFNLEDIPVVTYDAGGPNGNSFGTYQHDNFSKEVRLFYVSDGGEGRMSYYEAEETGEDMCPCTKQVELWITNEISVIDVRAALEKGILPKSYLIEDW
jgi:hypothetical protein